MSDNNNKCYLCQKLCRYYTKGANKYDKTNCGYCTAQGRIVGIHDGCEQYEKRRVQRRNKAMLDRRINDLLTQVHEVRRILESKRDNEED